MTDVQFKVGDIVQQVGKEDRGHFNVVRVHERGRHVYCVNVKVKNTMYWIATKRLVLIEGAT